MILFAGGMRRAASTAQFNIARTIAEKHGGFGAKFKQERQIEEWCDSKHWVVIKSHMPLFRKRWARDRVMAVRCYRDMRDAYVSYMLLHNHTFDFVWEEGYFQRSLTEDKQWVSALPAFSIYTSRYEDAYAGTLLDLANEVTSIGSFMGFSISMKRSMVIAQANSKSAMKVRANGLSELDPTTYLIPHHVHKGQVGQYREVLSKRRIRKLNKYFGAWLRKHGYEV